MGQIRPMFDGVQKKFDEAKSSADWSKLVDEGKKSLDGITSKMGDLKKMLGM